MCMLRERQGVAVIGNDSGDNLAMSGLARPALVLKQIWISGTTYQGNASGTWQMVMGSVRRQVCSKCGGRIALLLPWISEWGLVLARVL